MDPIVSNRQLAPDFTLNDLQGNPHSLHDLHGKVVILNFWSAECPWAERSDRQMLAYLEAWGGQVVLWNIASNANEPVELLAQAAAERGLPVVLLDPGCRVADLYGAVTTPHVFVLDGDGSLRYQGAFDNTSFRQRTPTRNYLYDAVEAVLSGRTPDPESVPSYGCTIVRY